MSMIRVWTGRLAVAATWGFAFGTALDASEGLTPGALLWVWLIFWTAAAIAWRLTRAA